jgi:hypothetical protein
MTQDAVFAGDLEFACATTEFRRRRADGNTPGRSREPPPWSTDRTATPIPRPQDGSPPGARTNHQSPITNH